ncbi:MAG: hypothetical protein HYX78_08865 [Armatimonadetes bacterium]|nr:hypothetical protein [Armatimonadota bacterium]
MKIGIADAWDRLGLVVASSLIWALVVLVPVAVAAELAKKQPSAALWITIISLAAAVLLGAPLLAGIFRMAYKIVYREDPGLEDLAAGFRELSRSAISLALLNVAVVGVLTVDALFLLGVIGPFKGGPVLALAGILCIYLLLGWTAAAIYQLPALAAQRPMGQREGAIAAIKKSFLLAAHNPAFTIGLFVVILGLGILCAVSVLGMLVLYVGLVSVILTRALRELYIRYGIVEEPPEVVEDAGWKVG